jgi:hypothetical protein
MTSPIFGIFCVRLLPFFVLAGDEVAQLFYIFFSENHKYYGESQAITLSPR